MDKVAIYLRKSRADEQGASIEETLSRHKSTLLSFAKTNKLNIVKIYEEVVSGESLFSRPQMLELLQDIEDNKFSAVLCMDIDRLGRGNMKEQGIILETCKTSRTLIITPRKVYDLDNELDEQYSEFEALMARNEYKTIRRRMQSGRIKSVQEGCYISNAPLGYKNVMRDKKATLEIVEKDAEYIKMIFDKYVNEGKGSEIIAQEMTAMGVKGKRGNALGRTTVRTIISNPVYIGKVAWHKPEIYVDGLHEPIIDNETFEKAQIIRTGRGHPPSNKGIIENPLAGLAFCSNCGQVMQRQLASSKYNKPRILCTKKGCIRGSRLDLVEKKVYKALKSELEILEYHYDSQDKPAIDNKTKAKNDMEKELKKIDTQISNLHDFLEQGVYTIETFLERSTILTDKKNKLQAQLQKLHKKEKPKRNIIPDLKKVIDEYWSKSAQEKNVMLKTVVDKIEYSKSEWGNVFTISVILKL